MMPIYVQSEIKSVSIAEFQAVVFEAMGVFFDVHNEMGRFFDEAVYKRVVAERHGRIEAEVPIDVAFDGFRKRYYLDMLVCGCAPIEVKACRVLAPEHRAQLINYLFLTGVPRGKLVNVRGDLIDHEWVNAPADRASATNFVVDDSHWRPLCQGDDCWKEWLTAAVSDWGTDLDIALYRDAIVHVLGGNEVVEKAIDVVCHDRKVGTLRVDLVGPSTALRVTACRRSTEAMESHMQRLLQHTRLDAVQWVNITRQQVTFRTLERRAATA